MENDEALGVSSRVPAIQPRVSRENWAVGHVATMANIEAGVGGGVVSSRKCPCSPHKTSTNETREFEIRIFRFMTSNRVSRCLVSPGIFSGQ